jgi:hypothetical protein
VDIDGATRSQRGDSRAYLRSHRLDRDPGRGHDCHLNDRVVDANTADPAPR